jgi:predicted metalloprotease with PDZ domain
MTKATATFDYQTTQTQTSILYQVAMPQPESHLFEVTLQVNNWQAPSLDLKMPVWTPGSYLVREYAKQVQDLTAENSHDRQSLPAKKLSKNHWQIQTENVSDLRVRYHVYANELSVRTNHLDATHGYFNGAALFFFIPGLEQQAVQVEIILPRSNWQISTILPSVSDRPNTFIAKDFDTLVDSPFEIGKQRIYHFEALGKPHRLAIWGEGNAKPDKIISDTQKIIEVEANLFEGLPYEQYLFILHLSASGFGGLEHKDCCSLNYPRLGFRAKDKYHRFIQLVAHEFFHLWNVKRIRPKALEQFDYEAENYTTSLWFSEGTTSYYDLLLPLRAKIYDSNLFLDNLSKEITKYLTTPGRKVQPLSESSFDAWIKLYRRDRNSDNNQISYYLKGEMISLLLDLMIRNRSQNKRSLDDIMRQMWQRFGKDEIGFTPEQLKEVIESVAHQDLTDFFQKFIDGTDELPFNDYLQPFGLQLQPIKDEEAVPYLGIRVQTEHGREIVQFTEADSPAASAGIDADDELVAIDGIRLTSDQLSDRLKDYQAGDTIEIAVFHQDRLHVHAVKLAAPQPSRYEVVKIQDPTDSQTQNFQAWMT